MGYKDQYRPTEAWVGELWHRFPRGSPIVPDEPVP